MTHRKSKKRSYCINRKGGCPGNCFWCGAVTCDSDGCGRENNKCDPATLQKHQRCMDAADRRPQPDDDEFEPSMAHEPLYGQRLRDGFRMAEGFPMDER